MRRDPGVAGEDRHQLGGEADALQVAGHGTQQAMACPGSDAGWHVSSARRQAVHGLLQNRAELIRLQQFDNLLGCDDP